MGTRHYKRIKKYTHREIIIRHITGKDPERIKDNPLVAAQCFKE